MIKRSGKIDQVHEWLQHNGGSVICPVCAAPLATKDAGSICCPKGHSYDIGAKGTLHLIHGNARSKYDRPMLQSRRVIAQCGLFDPLLQPIASFIECYCPHGNKRLLDAGCGEGTLLHRLTSLLSEYGNEVEAAGIDLSKEGIRLAAGAYAGPLWCVADLTRLPFASGSFDCILNILSPSNNEEFTRVLATGGIVIKVVPGSDYLVEFRRALYVDEPRKHYENDTVVTHFKNDFEVLEATTVRANYIVVPQLWHALLEMSPLAWGADQKQLERLRTEPLPAVTTEWQILTGKPR